jgi:hypothetical protein
LAQPFSKVDFFLNTIYKMSKVSFSRELLGTIKFDFDPTKTRTLNARQAYDTSTSQIVLGSFPATAIKKTLAKSLLPTDLFMDGTAGVVLTSAGGAVITGTGLGKADRDSQVFPISGTVSWTTEQAGGSLTKNKKLPALKQADTATFSGTNPAYESGLPAGAATKSNATKDIFYGAITVGTGLYREWQGKYAVLKVDLPTNNAILRVYNE